MNKSVKNIDKIYIPVMLFIICLTGVFYVVNYPRRQMIIFAFLMLLVCALGFCLIKRGYKKESVGVFVFLLLSLLIKADYVIYTPSYVRQHDVIGFGAGFGQAAFIEYFYEKIRLIDFDPREYWGFFQPPLHHILAGLWLRIMNKVCPNYGWACDNVQLLTLMYSALIPFVSLKIFKRIGLHNKGLVASMLFVCSHPCFIIMAGSINNDILCVLLQLLAMYFFILWNEKIEELNINTKNIADDRSESARTGNRLFDGNMVYIILTAVSLGCAMMTKLSGILIAPAIGIILLYRLIEEIKGKNGKLCKFIAQYILFGAISIPLGIWSPVRNLIKFGVPLNYTPEVGEPISGHSLLARIFDIRTNTPFTNLIDTGAEYDEYNFFTGMIKTSLVGEYTFAQIPFATIVGWVLLISGVILSLLILYCSIKATRSKEEKLYLRIFMAVYSIATMIFYVNLIFSIPNFSSLDFRYIAHTIVIGGYYIGFYVNHTAPVVSKNTKNSKNYVNLKSFILVTLTIFAISSFALYLLAGSISWR